MHKDESVRENTGVRVYCSQSERFKYRPLVKELFVDSAGFFFGQVSFLVQVRAFLVHMQIDATAAESKIDSCANCERDATKKQPLSFSKGLRSRGRGGIQQFGTSTVGGHFNDKSRDEYDVFEPFRASEGVEDASEDGGELMPLRGLA